MAGQTGHFSNHFDSQEFNDLNIAGPFANWAHGTLTNAQAALYNIYTIAAAGPGLSTAAITNFNSNLEYYDTDYLMVDNSVGIQTDTNVYHLIERGSTGNDNYDFSQNNHIVIEEDVGGGNDTISYASLLGPTGVNVDLGVGSTYVGTVVGQAKDYFDNIENVIGSDFDDTIWGNEADNLLEGRDGADEIEGFQGADTIDAGDGNDTIYGTGGGDILIGGAGLDYYTAKAGDVIIDADGGRVNGASFIQGGEHIWHAGTTIHPFKVFGNTLYVYNGGLQTAPSDTYFTIQNFANDGRWGFTIPQEYYDAKNEFVTDIAGDESPDENVNPEGGSTTLSNPTNGHPNENPSAGSPTLNTDDTNQNENGYLNHTSYLKATIGFDTQNGGDADDVYEWGTGFHDDILIDAGGNDTIKMLNLNEADVKLEQVGDDIVITAINSTELEELTIQGHYLATGAVESIEFADGSTLGLGLSSTGHSNAIEYIEITGTSDDTIVAMGGADTIRSWDGNDSIDAGAGDDSVLAGDGTDTVFGGAGDDYIHAGEGDDSIEGGAGDDYIYGADGVDTLIGGLVMTHSKARMMMIGSLAV